MLNANSGCQLRPCHLRRPDKRVDRWGTGTLVLILMATVLHVAEAAEDIDVIEFRSAGSVEDIALPAIHFGSPMHTESHVDEAVYQQLGNARDDAAEAPQAPWSAEPMSMLSIDIRTPAGSLPKEYLAPDKCESACVTCGRGWSELNYCYAATGMYANPLYFEEINLERYGYGCRHCLQPAVSAAHFFARVPALPYLMAVDCPGECNYTLGYYRPGDCVPWRHHCVPSRCRGGFSQAGIVTAMVFLLP